MGGVKRTYNTKDSLVETDPTTSLALTDLSMGERTGSRVIQWVWSYVVDERGDGGYEVRGKSMPPGGGIAGGRVFLLGSL